MLFGHYEKAVDRESAYEKLKVKTEQKEASSGTLSQNRQGPSQKSETTRLLEAMAKSAAHAVGSQIGRQIIRGVLGTLFGKGGRR